MKCMHRLFVAPVINNKPALKLIRHASIGDLCNALEGMADQLCGSPPSRLHILIKDLVKCVDTMLSADIENILTEDAELLDMGAN